MTVDLKLWIDLKFCTKIHEMIALSLMDTLLSHHEAVITPVMFDPDTIPIEAILENPSAPPALILPSQNMYQQDSSLPSNLLCIENCLDIEGKLHESSLPRIFLASLAERTKNNGVLFSKECEPLPPSDRDPFPCPDGCIPPPLVEARANEPTGNPYTHAGRVSSRDAHHPI